MVKLTKKEVRAVGLDFIEYLRESGNMHIIDKDQLQLIYNLEFRESNDPNFSRVLYVLRDSNKAWMTKSRKVYFNKNVRMVLQDQWRRPRTKQKKNSNQSVNTPPPNGPDVSPSSSAPPPRPGIGGGVRGRRRLAQEIIDRLSNERSEFVSDKNGVEVRADVEMVDGKVYVCVDEDQIYEFSLFVENKGPNTVIFTYYSPLHWMQCFTFKDPKKVTPSTPLLLNPGEKYEIKVGFFSDHVGVYLATVAFEFKLSSSSKSFHIVRFIEARIRTELAEALAPIEPFKQVKLSSVQLENFNVDEGTPPESFCIQHLKYIIPLDQYKCPNYINDLAKCMQAEDDFPVGQQNVHLKQKKSLLESPLDFSNYAERFQLLIHLEETQMQVDIKRYDKKDVTMNQDPSNKNLLVLSVPGVSENRPSVLRGDHLLVTKMDDLKKQTGTKYKGYVHEVELDQLKLGFSSRFLDSFINNMKFRVEFTVNRVPVRLQHRAVQLAVRHKLKEVLFPKGSQAMIPAPGLTLSLFDRSLEENLEQYTAVCNIVAGVSKPAPYLVFGPPGTGKTVTMVEAIKQVEKCLPDAQILACAPSNSATDQLCVKLLQHVDRCKLYRLYASSRDPKQVPSILKELKVCNIEGKMCVFPHKEELMKYKILITTVVTAGRLVTGGFPEGHFTHIFVDEAGHAVEPETIIAVAGLLRAETGQLVLAGDPMQLGPILRSPVADKYGLGLSLLKRLMTQNPLYQKGENGYNNQYVTKLLRNYRSHKSILEIPNELFYDGELQPFADLYTTSMYCNWEHLPKRGFPMIFHGVPGKDDRESNSPSFFNAMEIVVVVGYLKKLLLMQGKKGISKIHPRDIGIITPYRKQVEKLRTAITARDKELKDYKGIDQLKVGSVEEFQGQERRVIIVSTVRSTTDFVTLDAQFNIGFLKNEKRFNVAVTRARSLLIVVGNPIILSSDPTWLRFIDYCTVKGGYTGLNRASVEGTEEVVARLMALSIRKEEEVDTEESVLQQHVDPEWRNEQ